MSIDDLMRVTEVFGPGGGLLVFLGMLAIGVLVPVLRREQKTPKDAKSDLVADRDIFAHMIRHDEMAGDFERRIARLERKVGD